MPSSQPGQAIPEKQQLCYPSKDGNDDDDERNVACSVYNN